MLLVALTDTAVAGRTPAIARAALRRHAVSSYAQGGIVERFAVRSESLIRPSGLPSSSTSTLDHSLNCARTLTFAFFGTRLSDLQTPALLSCTTGVARIAKRRWSKILWFRS